MSDILLVNLSSLPMPGNDPIYPIGVRCIQQALQSAGHHVRVVDFVETPDAHDDLCWARDRPWDIIGFAIRNIDPIDLSCEGHVDAYADYVRRVKAEAHPGALMVGGGPGFSLFAPTLTERLDLHVGVRGPGESVMLDLAADPGRHRSGRQVIDGSRFDGFVSTPLSHEPRLMAAYAVDRSSMIGVETRRKTCFQRCIYCPYAYITGENSGDLKPLALLREEIDGIYRSGFRRIFFTDGIFNSGITYAKQVVGLLAQGEWPGLTWGAYFAARPFDDEFAGLLGRSGVEAVVVSPDSLDDGLMKRLGKNFDLCEMERFIATCRRHALPFIVNVVFGAPGETRDTARNSAHFINRHLQPHELSLHVGYRVLPHTALAAETGLAEPQLLYPTFYPFDAQLFQWMMQDLEPQILTATRLINLLAGRASMRRMATLRDPAQAGPSSCDGASVVAFTRARVAPGVSA